VAESFTICGLLGELVGTYEDQAFRAWWELEETLAGKPRRFVDFSKGARELRRRAGHHEMSEQEMAEEDHQGDDVLAIDREARPAAVVELEQLLTVAESEGLDAARAWLTVRGVRWRGLAPSPRREPRPRPTSCLT
jgi:hypothetical protein